jgi:septal ring factor EnvC (AmiA/AmiB activator)
VKFIAVKKNHLRWFLALLLTGAVGIFSPAWAATAVNKTTQKAPHKKIVKKHSSHKAPAPHGNKKHTPRKNNKALPTTTKGDLARVQEQIRSAENRIKLTQAQREQKEAEVKQAEGEIGELKGSVGSVQKEVSSREKRLQELSAEQAQRLGDRDRLVNRIKADLQMAQRQGGQDYYKLLLNQQNPQTFARLMKYYGYLQEARAERVQTLNATMVRLDAIAREEEEGVQRLKILRGELQEKQGRLTAAQQQRTQAIHTLNAQLDTDAERLQKLRNDQQALQSVMDRLAREAAAREQRDAERRRLAQEKATTNNKTEVPGKPASATNNETTPSEQPPDYKQIPYSGNCRLPVSGGLRSSFGSPRAGGLRWNGIVIAAPAGTSVRAVRPGRVAFADYLRGYGFLIIVDHGRGLMSLYGQNQSLQKKAGDEVGGNEVIATVGDTGGNDADGLYFEIRVHGRPTDPAKWCSYQ